MAVWILDAELAGPRSARCRSCSRSPRCAHGLRGRRSRRRRRGCRYSRCCPKGEARARSRIEGAGLHNKLRPLDRRARQSYPVDSAWLTLESRLFVEARRLGGLIPRVAVLVAPECAAPWRRWTRTARRERCRPIRSVRGAVNRCGGLPHRQGGLRPLGKRKGVVISRSPGKVLTARSKIDLIVSRGRQSL